MSSFHGCMCKNKDGSNRTCSQEQKQELVKRSDFNRYCWKRGREDIKRWLEADDSELYFMKESDRFFVLR